LAPGRTNPINVMGALLCWAILTNLFNNHTFWYHIL